MGPDTGSPEIACQSQSPHNGVITSGGGFSSFYSQPTYQKSAVQSYLTSSAGGQTAVAGYNPAGRGYPDLSFLGTSYLVYVDGQSNSIYGTSASTPVAAAMSEYINCYIYDNCIYLCICMLYPS